MHRCVEKSTGREYAVKIIDVSTEKATPKEAEELREDGLREIRVLRQLSGHKNIIQLHDCYQSPAFLFIVFELAEGGDLFDQLTTETRFSEAKTRNVMRQLFQAVDAMHMRNIVHRDLKVRQ